jgi:glycosyltransferase involved in cell wall biosynthesis
MFRDVCARANIEPVFLHGKNFEIHHQLYDGIDVFMYTSQSEGAGLGMLEAASCKIPVITTKVGYALCLKNIKTFDTVDEAVALIQWLNSDPSVISEYTEVLADEIKRDWDWKVVTKYWKPVFEKKLGKY